MKTSEIIFKDIDNRYQVDIWYNLMSKEPTMNSHRKDEWVGEHIYEIYYKNKLVGYIAYSRWEDTYCLSCIYILKEHRHLGIASAAVRKLTFQLKGLGLFFYGFVHKDNQYAISLYSKLGFKFLDSNRTGYIYDLPNMHCAMTEDYFYEFGKGIK